MPTYAIDLAGTTPQNLINPAPGTEDKTLILNDNLNNRVFQPLYAPFFKDEFIVEWQANSTGPWVALTENADYKFAYRFTAASLAAGKSVYAAIIINAGNSPGKIRFKQYRTIGGPWSADKTAAIAAIINGNYDPRVVHWDEVHGVPDQLPLTPHLLAATDLAVHNELVVAINNLSAAVGAGNHDEVLNYLLSANKCGEICDPVDRSYINGILERIRAISLETLTAIDGIVLPQNLDLRNNTITETVAIGIGPTNNSKSRNVSVGIGCGVDRAPAHSVNVGSFAGSKNDETLSHGYVVSELIADNYYTTIPDPTVIRENIINIGRKAGYEYAEPSSINIGQYAGEKSPKYGTVNIGRGAGREGSRVVATNIGFRAGRLNSGMMSTNIGPLAGDVGQTGDAEHDYLDGPLETTAGLSPTPVKTHNQERVVNVGWKAGEKGSKQGAINIGHLAGSNVSTTQSNSKGVNSINIGVESGINSGTTSVNVGHKAGNLTESGTERVNYPTSSTIVRWKTYRKGENAVNIGNLAGTYRPGVNTISIGTDTGNESAHGTISIGGYAGHTKAATKSVNLGFMAGYDRAGLASINIGKRAGSVNDPSISVVVDGETFQQGTQVINIGSLSGRYKAGANSVNIGRASGQHTPSGDSVNIGHNAGENSAGFGSVNIGRSAGRLFTSDYTVSIGAFSNSSIEGVSIGYKSGANSQNSDNTYIGHLCGTGHPSLSLNSASNTGVGRMTLFEVRGNTNTAMGALSLNKTKKSSNLGLGYASGSANENGYFNVFIAAKGHVHLKDVHGMFLLSLGGGAKLASFGTDTEALDFYTGTLSGVVALEAKEYLKKRLVYINSTTGALHTPI